MDARVGDREPDDRGADRSTAETTLLPPAPDRFEPVRSLSERLEATRELLARLSAASTDRRRIPIELDQPTPVWSKAAWREGVWQGGESAAIVIAEARIEPAAGGTDRLHLKLVSTAFWKEFDTRITADLWDANGARIGGEKFDVLIRTEGVPAVVETVHELPMDVIEGEFPELPRQISLSAEVRRLTAQYHGHGIWWMMLSDPQGGESD